MPRHSPEANSLDEQAGEQGRQPAEFFFQVSYQHFGQRLIILPTLSIVRVIHVVVDLRSLDADLRGEAVGSNRRSSDHMHHVETYGPEVNA